MSTEIRQKRVKGLLLEELMTLIPGELEDPQLALVSVTDVVVSKDLKNVRVFVTTTDEEVTPRIVVSQLNKALPFLRAQLAERLTTRVVPEITFTYDDTGARAGRLDELFRQIKQEESQKGAPVAGAPTGGPSASEPAASAPAASASAAGAPAAGAQA